MTQALSLPQLRAMHLAGERLAMLTCYDASFAHLLQAAGVDILLVGDSLGMVLQGRADTLAVSLDEMVYHTACVARARGRAWLVADMPFGSYQADVPGSLANAMRLVQAGAQMVKLEGAGWTLPLVAALVERGIPVCGHLGLTPQSVHALGGWRVQGREQAAAQRMKADAHALAEAGATLIVLELVPSALAAELAAELPVPLIGIGAGPATAGQVLVLHDMLGLHPGRPARFVRNFMAEGGSVADAVRRYVQAVKDGSFPDPVLHGY